MAEKAIHLHTPHEHRIAATRLLNEAEAQDLAMGQPPSVTDILLAAVVHALLAQRP